MTLKSTLRAQWQRNVRSPRKAQNVLPSVLLISSVFLTLPSLPQAHAADIIDWDVNRAIARGTHCRKNVDTFFSTAGNDLAVVFSALGIDFPAGSGQALAGRAACSVRVPATIRKGLYVAELTQRITYGVTKTAGSLGAVATRSTFFSFNVSPYTVHIPYGAPINNPLLQNSRTDKFRVDASDSWWAGWCRPTRAPRGNYQANFAVSGQRDSDREDLIMFVDGLDLKFEALSRIRNCR